MQVKTCDKFREDAYVVQGGIIIADRASQIHAYVIDVG